MVGISGHWLEQTPSGSRRMFPRKPPEHTQDARVFDVVPSVFCKQKEGAPGRSCAQGGLFAGSAWRNATVRGTILAWKYFWLIRDFRLPCGPVREGSFPFWVYLLLPLVKEAGGNPEGRGGSETPCVVLKMNWRKALLDGSTATQGLGLGEFDLLGWACVPRTGVVTMKLQPPSNGLFASLYLVQEPLFKDRPGTVLSATAYPGSPLSPNCYSPTTISLNWGLFPLVWRTDLPCGVEEIPAPKFLKEVRVNPLAAKTRNRV